MKDENANQSNDNASGGLGADPNPFLATQDAQRMMGGSYPETDVARASLYQMNEISRRAGEAGMTFGNGSAGGSGNAGREGGGGADGEDGGGGGGEGGGGDGAGEGEKEGKAEGSGASGEGSSQSQSQSQMRQQNGVSRIMAAGLGLMAPPDGGESGEPMSRADALAAIEELQRNRPQSRIGAGVGGGGAESTSEGGSSSSSAQQQQQQRQRQQTTTQVSGSDPFIMPPSPTPGEPGSSASAEQQAQDAMQGFGSASSIAHEGLQVFTLGHLMPRSGVDDANGNWTFDASSLDGLLPLPLGDMTAGGTGGPQEGVPVPEGSDGYANSMNGAGAGPSSGYADGGAGGEGGMRPPSAQKLRVRRTAFVPGWSVPPRVLLVEDDAVSRKLSSKFLQVFGCTIDVAVDGMAAVNKMNLEKYDLVLMVSSSGSLDVVCVDVVWFADELGGTCRIS